MINTTWGYDINTESMPTIISAQEFNTMTAGKFSGDTRIQSMIDSATASVRNYCGWHLGGSVECSFDLNGNNGRCIYNGTDLIIQLPARYVSAVTTVLVNAVCEGGVWSGTEAEFDIERNGVLTVYDVVQLGRKAKIHVVYTAGIPDSLMNDIKEIVAYKVTQGLTNSNGIQSETTGGISVTYSAAWASQQSTTLPDEIKSTLNLYRLQGVF